MNINRSDLRVALALMRHQVDAMKQALTVMSTTLAELEKIAKPPKIDNGKS